MKINITNSDLKLIICCCFRYSLGRITYMPSTIVSVIIENSHLFNLEDWKRFINEIDECSDLGMDCDKNTWNTLKLFSKEQLKEYNLNKKEAEEK